MTFHIYFVPVLPCCRSLQVSIPKKEYEVARGGDITLTCSFIPARPVTKSFVLTWEGFPKKEGDPMVRGLTIYTICAVLTSSKYSSSWELCSFYIERPLNLSFGDVFSMWTQLYNVFISVCAQSWQKARMGSWGVKDVGVYLTGSVYISAANGKCRFRKWPLNCNKQNPNSNIFIYFDIIVFIMMYWHS